MKEELGTAGAIVGAVILAFLLGGLVLAIYPGWASVGAHLPPVPSWSDMIAAASAFGTCAAVVVVLWQASQRAREERYRRLEIANLHAAGMAASLKNAHDHLGLSHFLLWLGQTPSDKKKAVVQACEMLRIQLKRPSLEELTALTPLPNHCAQRIARAFDILEVVRHKAATFDADREQQEPELTQIILRGEWGDDLWRALEHLQIALQECAKAADIGAPLPTHLELYGDSSDWDGED